MCKPRVPLLLPPLALPESLSCRRVGLSVLPAGQARALTPLCPRPEHPLGAAGALGPRRRRRLEGPRVEPGFQGGRPYGVSRGHALPGAAPEGWGPPPAGAQGTAPPGSPGPAAAPEFILPPPPPPLSRPECSRTFPSSEDIDAKVITAGSWGENIRSEFGTSYK